MSVAYRNESLHHIGLSRKYLQLGQIEKQLASKKIDVKDPLDIHVLRTYELIHFIEMEFNSTDCGSPKDICAKENAKRHQLITETFDLRL